MTYYIKDSEGNFTEADPEKMFKERHDQWVHSESTKIREDVEKSVREELTTSITQDVEAKVKSEYQPKLDEATKNVQTLETSLRRKTIAAEFGFKPETEKYLGDGSDEDMRKEAETLKKSFTTPTKAPEKNTVTGNKDSFIKLEKS